VGQQKVERFFNQSFKKALRIEPMRMEEWLLNARIA
jgi:hypothetical protein